MKGIRTVKKIAMAGALFLFDINRKLKLLISGVHGTKEAKLPLEKDKEIPKWIHPKTRGKAVQRAKYRANASRWNLDVAIFLFGILAIIVILGNQGVGIWILAPIATFGLTMVWIVGWRQAKKAYQIYINEELAQIPDEWKDYYKVLRTNPSAKSETITENYERISRICREALSERSIPLYSVIRREADEAYQVLSDPTSRANYDYIFWLKWNADSTEFSELSKTDLINLSQSITQEVSNLQKGLKWKIIQLNAIQKKTLKTVALVLLSIFVGATSFAFVNPEHVLAAPFRGVTITVSKTVVGAVELIEVVRGVGATSERKTVSTALQSMRVLESMKIVPAVTVPTNDMACFPSQECCLFPDYLDKRFSQFRYTVNSKGIVSVDTSWAATDDFIENIKQLIERLERGKQ